MKEKAGNGKAERPNADLQNEKRPRGLKKALQKGKAFLTRFNNDSYFDVSGEFIEEADVPISIGYCCRIWPSNRVVVITLADSGYNALHLPPGFVPGIVEALRPKLEKACNLDFDLARWFIYMCKLKTLIFYDSSDWSYKTEEVEQLCSEGVREYVKEMLAKQRPWE